MVLLGRRHLAFLQLSFNFQHVDNLFSGNSFGKTKSSVDGRKISRGKISDLPQIVHFVSDREFPLLRQSSVHFFCLIISHVVQFGLQVESSQTGVVHQIQKVRCCHEVAFIRLHLSQKLVDLRNLPGMIRGSSILKEGINFIEE